MLCAFLSTDDVSGLTGARRFLEEGGTCKSPPSLLTPEFALGQSVLQAAALRNEWFDVGNDLSVFSFAGVVHGSQLSSGAVATGGQTA